MKSKRSKFQRLLAAVLSASILFSFAVPASAAGSKKTSGAADIQYSTATKELIQKTIDELTEAGEVYQPEVNEALEEQVLEQTGLSLGAVKTSLVFDLFSNFSTGHIDTTDLGLDEDTLSEVLDMTMREFALDSAMESVAFELDEDGMASGIEFEMRESFTAGLGEIASISAEPAATFELAPATMSVETEAASYGVSAYAETGPDFYWMDTAEGVVCYAVVTKADGTLDKIEASVVEGPDADGKYTATYTVGTDPVVIYSDEFTPDAGEYEDHVCVMDDVQYLWSFIENPDTSSTEMYLVSCVEVKSCDCGLSVVSDVESTDIVATQDDLEKHDGYQITGTEETVGLPGCAHDETKAPVYVWTAGTEGFMNHTTYIVCVCGYVADKTALTVSAVEGVYDAGVGTTYEPAAPTHTPHVHDYDGTPVYYWTLEDEVYTDCVAFVECACGAAEQVEMTVSAEPFEATPNSDAYILYTATGAGVEDATQKVYQPTPITWNAELIWNYRYVADYTNQVGLVFRDGQIQAVPQGEVPESKIEFYLEGIKLTPMENNMPVRGEEPTILYATNGKTTTDPVYSNITYTTFDNGLTLKNVFVSQQYMGQLQAELEEELTYSGGQMTEYAYMLYMQLTSLSPCIFSNVLTASFSGEVGDKSYPAYDQAKYTDTINATEKAVYQYYAELCAFNAAYPEHFGSVANFWGSKDSEDANGTPILGALKVLCNMQPDTFVPFGAYDADGDGDLNMQTEIGLDFLISMLAQAFMAYEYNMAGLLEVKIAECEAQIPANGTKLQKLLALHDWLANNAEFDMGTITAMKDGSSDGSDPSQMTAYGTLLADMMGLDGAICLGYAATFQLLAERVLGMGPDEVDFVMVRWWANIADTSVAGPNSGFGDGDAMFNETHYFNAVKLDGEWYYIDACYDDIYSEVMTQYRVETDGAISHNFFLFSPVNALNMFEENIDYIDSAYDGVIFQRKGVDKDGDGQTDIDQQTMSPVYETDEDGHVLWYHSTYPAAAEDSADAERLLDASLDREARRLEPTAYDDNQYEKAWFTAATSEIYCDGTYYYYVAGELNSYAAMTSNQDDNNQWGDNNGSWDDSDVDVDMGEIFTNDDPAYGDRLVRRRMNSPVNETQDRTNAAWSREVEFEYEMQGQTQTGTRDVFVDPYVETMFHYGFGTLGQPKLDSDNTTPVIGDDGNYVNDKTKMPLVATYADIVAQDQSYSDIYPDLAHSCGYYNGNLYFNVANRIYYLNIAESTGTDWVQEIHLLKEYNTVDFASTGSDFGQQGSGFTGKTFIVTNANSTNAATGTVSSNGTGTLANKPIAAISIEDRWNIQYIEGYGLVPDMNPETGAIITYPTLTVSLGTNLTETQTDSKNNNYRIEAKNYNPSYIAGYSDEDANNNEEFMWCANLVEDIRMAAIDGAASEETVSVTVEPTCLMPGYTEERSAATGLSIAGTRVIDEAKPALGHDHEYDQDEELWICENCGAADAETHYPHVYNQVEFIDWVKGEDGSWTCTVQATCTCGGPKSVLVAKPNRYETEITIPATEEEPGEKVTTAFWTYDGRNYESANGIVEVIPAKGAMVKVTASSFTTQTGNAVEVPVTVKNNTGVNVTKVEFNVEYDKNFLSRAVNAEDIAPAGWDANISTSDRTIKVVLTPKADATAEQLAEAVLTLKFTKALKVGETTLKVSAPVVTADAEMPNAPEAFNGTVKIIDFIPGDANMDKKVNVMDLIAIANYISDNTSVTISTEAANVDGNSTINVMDLIAIANYISDPEGAPLA